MKKSYSRDEIVGEFLDNMTQEQASMDDFQKDPQGYTEMGDCYRICALIFALFFPPLAVLMVQVTLYVKQMQGS